MDYEHYETFSTLADTKKFTQTAELLNVSQSTVTNRIKQLENYIGKKLFIRDTRSVQLSEAGSVLYPFIKRGLEVLKQGEMVVRSYVDYDETLRIGTLISLWHYLLFPVVDQFKKEHQKYPLKLYSGPTKRMFQLLFDGLIDVCLVPTKTHHPDLECIKIVDEPFYLVGCPTFYKGTLIHTHELRNHPFIHIPWETPFMEWYNNEIGTEFYPSLEVDDTTLFTRFLIENKMIGFLPKSAALSYIERNELVKIPFISASPIPSRPIHFVYHRKKQTSRALTAFQQTLFSFIKIRDSRRN